MTVPTWRLAADDDEQSEFHPVQFRWLTQVGGRTFKEEPRWHRELTLSMQSGRHSAAEAVSLCYRRPWVPKDRVRFFRTADLVAASYLPYIAPVAGNQDHAAVSAPVFSDDADDHMPWWADEGRVTLQELATE
jgi:hypothetical protein